MDCGKAVHIYTGMQQRDEWMDSLSQSVGTTHVVVTATAPSDFGEDEVFGERILRKQLFSNDKSHTAKEFHGFYAVLGELQVNFIQS